uniref:Putative ovule protein n=1 Tax=Solanum chacoense TaxID=4108 RepID=A0A0V0GZW3_SOLCH
MKGPIFSIEYEINPSSWRLFINMDINSTLITIRDGDKGSLCLMPLVDWKIDVLNHLNSQNTTH